MKAKTELLFSTSAIIQLTSNNHTLFTTVEPRLRQLMDIVNEEMAAEDVQVSQGERAVLQTQ